MLPSLQHFFVWEISWLKVGIRISAIPSCRGWVKRALTQNVMRAEGEQIILTPTETWFTSAIIRQRFELQSKSIRSSNPYLLQRTWSLMALVDVQVNGCREQRDFLTQVAPTTRGWSVGVQRPARSGSWGSFRLKEVSIIFPPFWLSCSNMGF